MSQEIKVTEEAKAKIKSILEELVVDVDDNIYELTNIIDDINSLTINPEIQRIVQSTMDNRDNTIKIRGSVENIKNNIDLSLEELIETDEEIAKIYGMKGGEGNE